MPRLGHKKSRLGCRQCKARHVKCDELKPCSNCSRHGVLCSLVTGDSNAPQGSPEASATTTTTTSSGTSPRQSLADRYGTATASTPSPSLPPIDSVMNPPTPSPKIEGTPNSAISKGSPASSHSDQFPFLTNFMHKSESSQADLWLRDLELMHHWLVEACSTISSRDDIRDTWKIEAPKQALAHPFMMHELLAFSAFHLAHKNVEQRTDFYSSGIHHQDLAIRGIREKLHNVAPQEAVALVATSTLLTLSVFASTGFEANMPEVPSMQCPIDGILNIFSLMQGMGNVLAMAYMSVVGSWLAPILRDPVEPCRSQPMLQELSSHIPNLITFLQGKRDLSEPERTSYLAATAAFEPILQFAINPRIDNRELRFLFYWPLQVDHNLTAYIRNKKSGALVVLMYYATILSTAEPQYWFLDGWGDHLMRACYENVDQSWMSVLQWPVSFLHRRTMIESFAGLVQQTQSLKLPIQIPLSQHSPTAPFQQPYPSFPQVPHETRTNARTAPYPQYAPSAHSPVDYKPSFKANSDLRGPPAS